MAIGENQPNANFFQTFGAVLIGALAGALKAAATTGLLALGLTAGPIGFAAALVGSAFLAGAIDAGVNAFNQKVFNGRVDSARVNNAFINGAVSSFFGILLGFGIGVSRELTRDGQATFGAFGEVGFSHVFSPCPDLGISKEDPNRIGICTQLAF